MIKLAAISPKTIVSMGGEGGTSTPEEMQLKELLSQMAYSMLQSKAPNLAPYITSFKPIELDLDSNKAVGAFTLDLNGKNIMIPIVMSDGKVKPPEVFYSKEQDAFLPLNNKWMEEVQKAEASDLGNNVEAPQSLSGDVDIRALTLPPTTGRFVYASYRDLNLPAMIDNCDNMTKVAFSEVLKSKPKILKAFVKYNGASSVELLRPSYKTTKVASSQEKQWSVLTPRSSRSEFMRYFGNGYHEAFSRVLSKGYIAKDMRKHAEVLVDTEVPLDSSVMARSGITEPNFPGVYNIASLDGKTSKVYIVPRPFLAGGLIEEAKPGFFGSYTNRTTEAGGVESGRDYGMLGDDHGKGAPKSYLVISSDKKVGVFNSIVALTTTESMDDSALVAETMSERRPKNGDKLFVSYRAGDITNAAYFPEGITNVVDNGSGDITAEYNGNKVVFTTSKAIRVPKLVTPYSNSSTSTIMVPQSYKPVSVSGSMDNSDYITNPDTLRTVINGKIDKIASQLVRVKKSSDGSWAVNGQYCDSNEELLSKLGSLNVNIEVAQDSIKSIKANSSKLFRSFKPSNLVKLSSIFGPDAAPQGMPPEQMGGMPPQGMAGPGMPQQAQNTMQAAADLNDESIFNASAAASLLQYNPLNEAVAQELPNIEKALDSTARVLVSVQMREAELVSQIGQDAYTELESNLRKVLGGLGDIILTLHKQKSMTSLPEGISG